MQQTQHQVTTLQRQFRVTPRVVDRRAFYHAHQQRLLVKAQLFYRTAKVVQARQREAADLVIATLTEVHLVHVQFKDTILAVARIHQHGHVRFVGFTPVRALAGEEQVFHQLLGQGTRPLHRTPGGQVRQYRTTNGVKANTVVLVEVAVFGCQQGIYQQIREAVTRHEQALFAVCGRQHGDETRIETEETELAIVIHVLNGFQAIAVKGQTRAHLPLFTVREVERTADHLNAFRLDGKFTRTGHFRDLTILRGLQQLHHLVLADRHVRLKVHHAAVHCRRQLPDFPVDTAADLLIQINAVNRDQDNKNNKQLQQQPEPAALTTRLTPFAFPFTRHRFFILIIVFIVIVILLISEATTAYLFFRRTRRLSLTSYWLAVIPRHAFSPQHSGAKARFSYLAQVSERRNLSKFVSPSPTGRVPG